MSPLAALLQFQIEHLNWANQRVLTAVSQLSADELEHDFKFSDKSIRCTLAHIYRAERTWLARIEDRTVGFQVPGDDAMSFLAENWPQCNGRWLAWSQNITEEQALSAVTYQDLRNKTWSQPLWQIVVHVANHSTHHRGQVIGFIRALGHTPPNVDAIAFARTRT